MTNLALSGSQRLSLCAPAKVNLSLEVLGKRPDGYHELRMLVVAVSLFDRLVLDRLPEPGRVSVWCRGDPGVRGGRGNLCHRAAQFYLAKTGVQAGVRIRIRKTVPSGAGLGGGSSDAAATILGLERLFGRRLGPSARRRVPFEIGADVPFFLHRSPAWVEGIGERVRPIRRVERLWLVLVFPGVSLSTARVFSRWDEGLTSPRTARTMSQFRFQGFVKGLRNDLQGPAVAIEPRVGQALEALGRAGASGRLMTGSGSAVFGLFPDEATARRAAAGVRTDPGAKGWRVEVVHTLPPGAFPFLDGWNPDWGVDKRQVTGF